jgi:NAD(P)H-dependent FMN reductase
MSRRENIETEVIDLLEWNLPIMEERLRFHENPPESVREFSQRIARADSVVIVTPEYNHGYPGVLKNALDYLLPEYKRKPIGIVTVSGGNFGGINCLEQLRLVTLGFGAFPIPAALPVSRVQESFDAEGNPKEAFYEKNAENFINEVVWFAEAIKAQREKGETK